ncbi:MAG: hypothetical protein UX78_C0001G0081 [Candidatus Amesbacteria bacterium GW2011_GWA2_47_11]|uniref:Uncharacterized protein n=2 Tax=Candidatus Amesiibacteriota TaxID=1752730 RepID=A0A0G1TS74_9BACT|nr:MAG: hypothetical protein UX78_C0001G0081 [Candidatus Amesbacteria bacterium GW2011_GWA2_47_11]KKW00222.1 MAG: hypothetical protein UY33_C0014G0033 [Candidatus Amesbacteria bacterium GW2011_GWA1_48_9]
MAAIFLLASLLLLIRFLLVVFKMVVDKTKKYWRSI